MAWNMPDGASTDEYDRYCGYDLPDEEDEREPHEECPEGIGSQSLLGECTPPAPSDADEAWHRSELERERQAKPLVDGDSFKSHAGVNRRTGDSEDERNACEW